ncbi:DUF305 domain-containing protein [Streptomyces sp. TS71-3]|uniref:DUF305 domain-containing protein n=1 Tax=Streptomyces sp. TS71-3 TaxID=2733862 RepID=UPI0035AB7E13
MPGRRPLATGAVLATALAAALLLTAGCDSGSGGAGTRGHGTGDVVVAPGKPGEPARTLSPEDAAKAVPDEKPDAADIAYAQMMITHHGQALEMTRLAETRAHADPVKRIARHISATQKPEIEAMRGWLERNGLAGDAGPHAHMRMAGMATGEQLARLKDARGTAFDRLFLTLMITHHQGAVTMATDVLARSTNTQIGEMATDLIAQQTREVDLMRAM